MSRVLVLISAACFFAGCATARVEKMSFEEAFDDAKPAARAPKPWRKTPVPPPPKTADESLELQAELARFGAVAREQRLHTKPGAQMPPAQRANWIRLLDALDDFLDREAQKTASTDVVRARVAAEAELEMDARAYGDFPEEVAERVLDRVTRLAIRMAELRRLQHKPSRPQVRFEWPIDPVLVTSLYGRRVHPISGEVKQHTGVDLGAYPGQLVSAAAKGTVIRAGWNGAHGVQVEIQHPGGVMTRYSHLASTLVEQGDLVDKGDPVGLAGTSGLSTGIHLHFELWRDGKPRDPLEELADQAERPAVAGVPSI